MQFTYDNYRFCLNLVEIINLFFYKKHDFSLHTFYFPAAICFMRLRALPALNHVICCSLNVWFSLILSTFPSACLISQSTCLPGAMLAKPRSEILSVG